MKLVYISGPITRGNQWANGSQADDAMLALMRAGIAVHNPMLTMWAGACREVVSRLPEIEGRCDFLTRPKAAGHHDFVGLGHGDWLAGDKEIVSRCDAVLRLPGESTGADIETAHAVACGVPVYHDLAALVTDLTREVPQ